MSKMELLRGSCLCAAVRFVVHGPLGQALNCHCSVCRKAHAAAYRSRVAVEARAFTWVSGEELISWYESSPTTRRGFCSKCGSRLVSAFADDPESLGVPLALFDDDPGARPELHVLWNRKHHGTKSVMIFLNTVEAADQRRLTAWRTPSAMGRKRTFAQSRNAPARSSAKPLISQFHNCPSPC